MRKFVLIVFTLVLGMALNLSLTSCESTAKKVGKTAVKTTAEGAKTGAKATAKEPKQSVAPRSAEQRRSLVATETSRLKKAQPHAPEGKTCASPLLGAKREGLFMKIYIAGALFAGTTILGLSGCVAILAGGAAGAGTMAYIMGELKDQLTASTGETQSAIDQAVERLELEVVSKETDKLSGDYKLKSGGDEKIHVQYERIDDHITEISIRVGILGDENLSHALLIEIKKGL